jgi:hypothetical protein
MKKKKSHKRKKRKIQVWINNELPGVLRTGMSHGEYVQSLQPGRRLRKRPISAIPFKNVFIRIIPGAQSESSRRRH